MHVRTYVWCFHFQETMTDFVLIQNITFPCHVKTSFNSLFLERQIQIVLWTNRNALKVGM
jgi:hypothetical protein